MRILPGKSVWKNAEKRISSPLFCLSQIIRAHFLLYVIMRHIATANFGDKLMTETDTKCWKIGGNNMLDKRSYTIEHFDSSRSFSIVLGHTTMQEEVT